MLGRVAPVHDTTSRSSTGRSQECGRVQLYYGKLRQPNFGDDLNSWLWTTLMPECVGGEQDVTFVGIGTLIADRIPRRQLRVVFCTGAG